MCTNHPYAATMRPMDVENLSGLTVHRADPSDSAALAKIDSVAAAGDHVRPDTIRRWCEHGVVLMARDPSGPLGYSVLECNFFEQGFVTMLMVAPTARRRGAVVRHSGRPAVRPSGRPADRSELGSRTPGARGGRQVGPAASGGSRTMFLTVIGRSGAFRPVGSQEPSAAICHRAVPRPASGRPAGPPYVMWSGP